MGTQFTRRLKEKERREILVRIHEILDPIHYSEPRRPRTTTTTTTTTKPPPEPPPITVLIPDKKDRIQIGRDVLGTVVDVVEHDDFRGALEHSEAFIKALDWLDKLRLDAKQNDFKATIRKHRLGGVVNPTSRLMQELRKFLKSECPKDRFRVVSTAAGKRFFIEVATRMGKPTGTGSAQRFGDALARYELEQLVELYVGFFVADFLARVIAGSNPGLRDSAALIARELSGNPAARVAAVVVKRVEREGLFDDWERADSKNRRECWERVRSAVFAELHRRRLKAA